MKRATFYDLTDGKITGTLICSEPYFEANVEGKTWIEGTYDLEEYYVVRGIATLRPSFSLALSKNTIIANGTDNANLTGVPSGAVVTMERSGGGSISVTADGTTVEITATMPGNYLVTVSKWPYRDEVFTVAATV